MSSVPGAKVSSDVAFDAPATRRILDVACREQGLNSIGAELMRLGENAVYRLRDNPIVARIARHADSSRKEVDVARWLAEYDFPAVRLFEELEQLVVVDGRIITWWNLIERHSRPPEFIELAAMLRQLHDVPAPTSFQLPPFTPMSRVPERLDSAPQAVTEPDLGYLRDLHERLQNQYAALTFQLQPGPIHGDAHVGNLIRDQDGMVRLIDFEVFAWGPREWDACIFGAAYRNFDWIDSDEYQYCASTYGWDPLQWQGFSVIRAVRELNMTTWLMQRNGESREIDDEIAKRVADLRQGDAVRRWRPF